MFNPKHPGMRLILLLVWALMVIRVMPRDLYQLAFLCLFPMGSIYKNWTRCIKTMLSALPILFFVGLTFLFDHSKTLTLFNIELYEGTWILLTLLIKGSILVLGISATALELTISGIIEGMTWLKVPKAFTLIFAQTYRYIGLLGKIVRQMLRAYSLRSGGRSKVHLQAWGSFPGQLFVLSLKHAESTHDAMVLRGFGEVGPYPIEYARISKEDVYRLILWSFMFTWIYVML